MIIEIPFHLVYGAEIGLFSGILVALLVKLLGGVLVNFMALGWDNFSNSFFHNLVGVVAGFAAAGTVLGVVVATAMV
jgi:hypothetical protein